MKSCSKFNEVSRSVVFSRHHFFLGRFAMKCRVVTLGILCFFFATAVQAAIVNVTPDSVNRLIAGTFANNHYADSFSTYGSDTQKTLVDTTNTNFLTELQNVLGPLGTGESYQINSATLTVGAVADDYATTGGASAHVVTVAWNSGTVTWNSFNGGGVAGVDYNAISADTGAVASPTTTWSGLGSTVQDWLDGSVTNNGLFFPDVGALNVAEFTGAANVSWSLDAQIVSSATAPEPNTLVLVLLGLLGVSCVRPRSRR